MSKIILEEIKSITEHRYLLKIKKNDQTKNFTLMSDTLIDLQLFKPGVLSEEDYLAIKDHSVIDDLKEKAIHYISFQPRLTREVITFLQKKEASNRQIKQLIDELTKASLLDDNNYIDMAIHQAIKYEFDGPYKVREKLIKKGADPVTLDHALRNYDETLEHQKLETLLEKELKYRFKKPLIKVMQTLKKRYINKGYTVHVVDQVLAQYKDDINKMIDEHFLLTLALKKMPSSMFVSSNRQKLIAKLVRLGYSYELIKSTLKEDFANETNE